MKNLAFILSIVLLLTVFSITALAEVSEQNVIEQTSSNSDGWDIAIVSIGMFVTISIIGVMFLKTVMKNNNKR